MTTQLQHPQAGQTHSRQLGAAQAAWLVAEREITTKLRSKAFLISTGVLLLPGSLYGETWAKHFRIGFGRVDFRQNCERLAGFCQKWNPGQGS